MAKIDPATGIIDRVRPTLLVCEIVLLLAFLIVLFFFRSSRYAITAFAAIAALSIIVTMVGLALKWRRR